MPPSKAEKPRTDARSMKAAIKRLKLLSLSPRVDIKVFRQRIEEEYYSPILPNKVEVTTRDYGGVMCDVLSPELYATRRVMLYIHGGSFVGGSARAYRGFCARLAHKTLSRVVIVDYAVSPDYPFGKSIEDAQSVFRALFTEEQVALCLDAKATAAGSLLPEIVIACDGAGCSIAGALLYNLKEKYRKSISHWVLLSPWLDISDKNELLARKEKDDVLSTEGMRRAITEYAGADNRNNPLVSPLRQGEASFECYPKVFIQIGEKEMLLEDAVAFSALLNRAGVECKIEVWPSMVHLFQLADDLLWETHLAIDRIGEEVCEKIRECAEEKYLNNPPLEKALMSD